MKHEAITKKLWRNLVALFAILIASSSAYATDIDDGGTCTINSNWLDLNCKGDATLTVKPTTVRTFADGSQYYFTQAKITATNGTVTLDFSQCTDHPVLFTKMFRAEKNGKVIFKGAGKMLVGTESIPAEPYPIFQASATLPFGIADAEVQDGFQGVEFVNRALLAMPMPTVVPWTVRNGAVLLTMAGDTFAGGYAGADKANLTGTEVTIANFDVCMMITNVFKGNATITVNANRTLHIKSMGLKDDWGLTSGIAGGWTYTQNIILADATSRLFPRCAGGMKLNGAVSGAGYLESYEDNGTSLTINGPLSFTGPIKLSGTMYVNNPPQPSKAQLTFNHGSIAWVEPKDVLLNFGQLEFATTMTGTIRIGTVTGLDFVGSTLLPRNASQTIEIGKVAGNVSVPNYASGTIAVAAAEDGAIIKLTGNCGAHVDSQEPTAKMSVNEGGTISTFCCFDGATVAHSAGLEIVSTMIPEDMTLNLPTGADNVELQGGSMSIGRNYAQEGLAYVAANASLWLDPSVSSSVHFFTNAYGTVLYKESKPYVMELCDRGSSQQWFAANYRGLGLFNDHITSTPVPNGTSGYTSGATTVYPLYRENFLNGLSVLDFSGNDATATRMMIFKDKYVSFASNGFTPAFCIMVYGSNGGGGSALLANPNGDFARSTDEGSLKVDGRDKPLIADNNNKGFEAWVNGAKVNVKDGYLLSGGWDIVSIDTKGVQVVGLGFAKSNTNDSKGTSQYAEVVFFNSVPADDMRQAIEIYLAEKWGLMGKITKPHATAMMSGKGNVAVVGDVKLSGSVVGGQISVADGAKVSYDAVLPATQAEVANIENCVAWFDPSDTASLVMSTGEDSEGKLRALEVSAISNRIAGASTTVLVGNNPNSESCRCPWLNREKRAYRSGMNWIDYSNHYSGDTMGDYMYFANKVGSYNANSFAGSAAQMAFIVSDSVRGGGSPIFDAPSEFDSGAPNGNGKIKVRIQKTHATAIWLNGTGSEVTGGKTYLNGGEVDGSTTGFTGAPEVFAFSTTTALNFGFQGCWSNSESGQTYGEILGESLYFGRVLTDDERNAVTSYLMWKWLGKVPAGYAMFGDAELAGSGTITGVTQAALPKLAAGFNGTVELSDASCEFQLTSPDETVGGAIIAQAATLKVPATITLKFDGVTNKLKPGEYVLFDVATLNGAETINLDYTGIPEKLRDRLSITKVGGKVCLVFASKGMILLVR